MKKTALVLMVMAVLTKILGFIRDITLSYFYGASDVSDAYLVAVTIPVTIFAFVGTSINTSYIPICSNIAKQKDIHIVNRFTSNVVNLLITLCSIIALISLVFTPQIVKIFASGFQGETLNLAVRLTKVSILGIFFSALIYLFSAYLQFNKNYIIPALLGIPLNFFIIISIPLSAEIGVTMLSAGIITAMAAEFVFLIPAICKKGYKYEFLLDYKDNYVKKMVILSLPLLIGVSADQINVLVDRTIASQIAVGGISSLTYANRIILFVQGIIASSIATVIYPEISRMVAENNLSGFKKSVAEAISGINILIVPTTIGALIFAQPIVKLLFGRGAFDSQSITMTSHALFFYSIGLTAFGYREVLARVFYSLQDTRTPTINAVLSMSLNIILNLVLSKYMGISGLALSTSISAVFGTSLLLISLRKKIGSFGMKLTCISFLKILCASLIMGSITTIAYKGLLVNVGESLSLLLSIGIGIIAYFTIILFMKIKEIDMTISTIKNKIKILFA